MSVSLRSVILQMRLHLSQRPGGKGFEQDAQHVLSACVCACIIETALTTAVLSTVPRAFFSLFFIFFSSSFYTLLLFYFSYTSLFIFLLFV